MDDHTTQNLTAAVHFHSRDSQGMRRKDAISVNNAGQCILFKKQNIFSIDVQ